MTWDSGPPGRTPWPLGLTALLAGPLLVWTMPQSLCGLLYALWKRLRGRRWRLYRFGPFLYLVVQDKPIASNGVSLGLVVFADRPAILIHEFCHLFTGLWLGWLYLPVYGLEYLIQGHDRSWHERITVRFERRTPYTWRPL